MARRESGRLMMFALLLAFSVAQAAPLAASPDLSEAPQLLVSIKDDDYPWAFIRDGVQGTTRSQIALDAGGKVLRCAPASSSGHLILDRHACAVVVKQLMFSPARNSSGQSVPVTVVLTLNWAIDEPLPPTIPLPAKR